MTPRISQERPTTPQASEERSPSVCCPPYSLDVVSCLLVRPWRHRLQLRISIMDDGRGRNSEASNLHHLNHVPLLVTLSRLGRSLTSQSSIKTTRLPNVARDAYPLPWCFTALLALNQADRRVARLLFFATCGQLPGTFLVPILRTSGTRTERVSCTTLRVLRGRRVFSSARRRPAARPVYCFAVGRRRHRDGSPPTLPPISRKDSVSRGATIPCSVRWSNPPPLISRAATASFLR